MLGRTLGVGFAPSRHSCLSWKPRLQAPRVDTAAVCYYTPLSVGHSEFGSTTGNIFPAPLNFLKRQAYVKPVRGATLAGAGTDPQQKTKTVIRMLIDRPSTNDLQKSEVRQQLKDLSQLKGMSGPSSKGLKASSYVAYIKNLVRRTEKLAIEKKGRPSVDDFINAIKAFARQKQPELCYQVLSRMKKSGVSPTSKSYEYVIHAYAMAGQWEMACSMVYEMELCNLRVTRLSFNSIFNALSRGNLFVEALHMSEWMVRSGWSMDEHTYCHLLNAINFSPSSSPLALLNPTPSAPSSSLRLRLSPRQLEQKCSSAGQHVQQLMEMLQAQGLVMTSALYFQFIRAYCLSGDQRKACVLFRTMTLQANLRMSTSHLQAIYQCLLSTCLTTKEQGIIQKEIGGEDLRSSALFLLTDMRERAGLMPTKATFDAILLSCDQAKDYESAVFFHAMAVQPPYAVYDDYEGSSSSLNLTAETLENGGGAMRGAVLRQEQEQERDFSFSLYKMPVFVAQCSILRLLNQLSFEAKAAARRLAIYDDKAGKMEEEEEGERRKEEQKKAGRKVNAASKNTRASPSGENAEAKDNSSNSRRRGLYYGVTLDISSTKDLNRSKNYALQEAVVYSLSHQQQDGLHAAETGPSMARAVAGGEDNDGNGDNLRQTNYISAGNGSAHGSHSTIHSSSSKYYTSERGSVVPIGKTFLVQMEQELIRKDLLKWLRDTFGNILTASEVAGPLRKIYLEFTPSLGGEGEDIGQGGGGPFPPFPAALLGSASSSGLQ